MIIKARNHLFSNARPPKPNSSIETGSGTATIKAPRVGEVSLSRHDIPVEAYHPPEEYNLT
jgi:hypothetical protein